MQGKKSFFCSVFFVSSTEYTLNFKNCSVRMNKDSIEVEPNRHEVPTLRQTY